MGKFNRVIYTYLDKLADKTIQKVNRLQPLWGITVYIQLSSQ